MSEIKPTLKQRFDRWMIRHGRVLVIGLPYLWLFLFFLVPFLIVLKISFATAEYAQPPYSALFQWVDEGVNVAINFGNYLFLLSDSLYITAYLNSIRIAAISTVITLLIGYPMAYGIARAKGSTRNLLLMLVILPFWTSFLIRVYAWIGILDREGLINAALMGMHIISEPLIMRQTEFAVYIGIVYTYLPFMILPIYSALERMDESLIEAAEDLGCSRMQAFWLVTIPLSRPVPYALGQHLCIDIEGEPVNPPADFAWPADFIVTPIKGQSETLGRGCGVIGTEYEEPLIVEPSRLVAGANMRVVAIGRVRTPGLLIVGPVLAQPLPLDSLGMTGCVLRVSPKVSIPISYGDAWTQQPYPSANAHVPLPRQPAILGAQFGMQSANLESGSARSNPLGVTLTNGLRLTVSNQLVDPDWTTVWSDRVWPSQPLPAIGTIRHAFAPVLRIDT